MSNVYVALTVTVGWLRQLTGRIHKQSARTIADWQKKWKCNAEKQRSSLETIAEYNSKMYLQ